MSTRKPAPLPTAPPPAAHPTPDPATDTLTTMATAVQQWARNLPVLQQVQHFWRSLHELQDWWLLLVPWLAWVGWRTYRKERAQIVQARRAKPHRQS